MSRVYKATSKCKEISTALINLRKGVGKGGPIKILAFHLESFLGVGYTSSIFRKCHRHGGDRFV